MEKAEKKEEELIHFCLFCNIAFETEKKANEHKILFDCAPVRIAPRDIAFVKKNIAEMRSASE